MLTVKRIHRQMRKSTNCKNRFDGVAVEFETVLQPEAYIMGKTCRCGKGCGNTWNITNVVGRSFDNPDKLISYLERSRNL